MFYSIIHESLHLCDHLCLLFIYLLANYRPLTWITSFIYMCLTILFDQDYDDSMSPQKLFCFIVYLLEDEQELSLEMLDTSQTYL